MTVIQAVILGIIQGVTEFLPISSSGHLAIVPYLSGWEQQSLDFDIIVHGATLLAILIFYRQRLSSIITTTFSKDPVSRKTSMRLIRNIVLTSVPATLIALLLKDTIESNSDNIPVIATALISVGIVLVYLERMFKNTRRLERIQPGEALFIGSMQGLALIRGVSRSGITIIGGALAGLSRKEAVDYAFLASIPVLTGSVVLTAADIAASGLTEEPHVLLAGFAAAFISGYAAISFLINYVKKHDFAVFGWYRIILGILLLIIAL
ncbi:MAG: Undecaprenyl-diphosphatase [candidate division WS6 bacterium OLB20]|uniref:Undecaprenyl-diphosphatase n=1 Tax=candidate division WS6 bacterium OLB20 TaxID=1617426 RepID=A0A136LY38_9BACT|nr:MAG: Undecaprenyl-diphosphatase [candidate division WS6 bacterium OLB20]